MAVDLLFAEVRNTSHPVNLTLGVVPGGGTPPDYITFAARIPVPTSHLSVDAVRTVTFAAPFPVPVAYFSLATGVRDDVTFAAHFPVMSSSLSTVYDNSVHRGPKGYTRASWQVAEPRKPEVKVPYQQSTRLLASKHLPYTDADPSQRKYVSTGWQQSTRTFSQTKAAWTIARPLLPPRMSVVWEQMIPISPPVQSIAWEDARPVPPLVSKFVWEKMWQRQTQRESPWEEAARRNKELRAGFNVARNILKTWAIPWQDGIHPRPGRTVFVVVVPPVKHVCYIPPSGLEVDLLFDTLWDGSTDLLFLCPGDEPVGQVIVPSARFYIIVNTVSLKRVIDDAPIEVFSASVSTDRSSWAWGFTATVAYQDLGLVEPTVGGPVEVELQINSHIWRFMVEEYDESKAFGDQTLAIKGRSLTANLDEPYAFKSNYTQTSIQTAVQLAQMELDRPTSAPGFSLDWQLVDPLGWSMPVGAWNYSDKTPIQALKELVEGVGGYVQSHPATKTLITLPGYPVPYWEWDVTAADIVLPKTILLRSNLRWMEKPFFNGVYVSGQDNGVFVHGRRNGTIGDALAEMYVHASIGDNAAARAKVIEILSSCGKQAEITLDLPMHADVGVITPGRLVEVTNGGYGTEPSWKGLVRGTTIAVSRGDGALSIDQSITLERHYGDPVS